MAKTWTAKDCYGRAGVWSWATCSCGARVPVLVGAAGRPTCDDCFDRWLGRAFPGHGLPPVKTRMPSHAR